MKKYILFLTFIILELTSSYSVIDDERIVRAELKRMMMKPPRPNDHAKVARNLVHKSKWASVGTISTDDKIKGYPMVNIMSIADGNKNGQSTGVIYFLSTTLDFTGKDIMAHNKTTFMISDAEDLHCSKNNMDPMEPTCARIHISGTVIQLDESFDDYKQGLENMLNAHPAAENWLRAHAFALCKLNIENIYVLDYYGGPHRVTADEYYKTIPDNKSSYDLSAETISELENALDAYKTKEININIKMIKNDD